MEDEGPELDVTDSPIWGNVYDVPRRTLTAPVGHHGRL